MELEFDANFWLLNQTRISCTTTSVEAEKLIESFQNILQICCYQIQQRLTTSGKIRVQ
jgi:hypothetical protein